MRVPSLGSGPGAHHIFADRTIVDVDHLLVFSRDVGKLLKRAVRDAAAVAGFYWNCQLYERPAIEDAPGGHDPGDDAVRQAARVAEGDDSLPFLELGNSCHTSCVPRRDSNLVALTVMSAGSRVVSTFVSIAGSHTC